MNVLGISFGRKMKSCEILVKEALMGAEAEGAEVSFLRMIDLDIQHCKACGYCGALKKAGKQIKCKIKDDFDKVLDEILNADAIIVAAPVYALAPVGQFKNLIDRFGPHHDMAAMQAEAKRREVEDLEPLDPRIFKQRYVGYICVGGASTHNWVSLGLPSLQLFGFSTLIKAVDQIDAYDMGRTGNPLLDSKLISRTNTLGRNVASAVGLSPEEAEWKGDEGVCPSCHCNLISIGESTVVECPVCGIEGTLSIVGDRIKVEFSKEQQNRSRNTLAGLKEHFEEIAGMGKAAGPKLEAAKDWLPAKLERYEDYLQSVI